MGGKKSSISFPCWGPLWIFWMMLETDSVPSILPLWMCSEDDHNKRGGLWKPSNPLECIDKELVLCVCVLSEGLSSKWTHTVCVLGMAQESRQVISKWTALPVFIFLFSYCHLLSYFTILLPPEIPQNFINLYRTCYSLNLFLKLLWCWHCWFFVCVWNISTTI